MFGYIVINKDELKIKDYNAYRAYYCGLCRSLKKLCGGKGQLTLSYDMTFLVVLLSALYEPEETKSVCRCIAHPLSKHPTITNECTDYIAEMNLLLTYYKCEDDWLDEHKMSRRAFMELLKPDLEKIREKYPEKCDTIKEMLQKITQCEKDQDTNLDQIAGYFGQVMAEIFAWRDDEWTATLRQMGFFLGKYIYLADAYEDIEKDFESGNYNPFLAPVRRSTETGTFSIDEFVNSEEFSADARHLLTMMISECCRFFERLPIIERADILRNILYSGVWFRVDLAAAKRAKKQSENQE